MVHKPVKLTDAFKIPAAKAALEKEWKKLEDLKAWDLTKVREKADVQAEAKRTGKTIHFGNLMQLCHQKKIGR